MLTDRSPDMSPGFAEWASEKTFYFAISEDQTKDHYPFQK